MYTIIIDYTNELKFEDFNDFTNTLGLLFQGGIKKEIRVKYEKEVEA